MVKVQIGVLNQHFGYIDPSKLKCLSCEAEFYYPYCDWAGGIMVVLCCPGCKKPITEYVNRRAEQLQQMLTAKKERF